MVLGVRIHGDVATDVEVSLDNIALFTRVPVAHLCGVPLFVKRQSGTGGDDSKIKRSAIVRVMADPDDGFAPHDWQYGGNMGPAPPVVLARKDKLPFSCQDWLCLESYVAEFLDEAAEAEEGRAEVSEQFLTPSALQSFVRRNLESWPVAFLSLQFPLSSIVVPQGLSIDELNGKEGEVVQFGRDRVGVCFRALPSRGVTALKPERLTLVTEAPLGTSEPEAKRHDTGEGKVAAKARAEDLNRQESMVISKRFVECLYQDTFPERGDLHLFGVGGSYQARATEVLAVWQGSVKNGDLTAEALADALFDGKVKELFEKLCHKIAASRTPNSPYARDLIEAKFAALEWDDL